LNQQCGRFCLDHQPTRQSRKQFELEALEPRVLLSADSLLVSASLAGGAHTHDSVRHPSFSAHEETLKGPGAAEAATGYNPADQLGSMFEGISGEAISSAPTATSGSAKDVTLTHTQVQSEPAAAPVAQTISATTSTTTSGQNSKPNSTSSSSVTNSSAEFQTRVFTSVSSATLSAAADVKPNATSTSTNPMTQQLTDTLKNANGPPASQSNGSQSINVSLPTTSTATTQVSSSSSRNGSSATVTANSVNLAISIVNALNAIANGGTTDPLNLPDATLGGVLDIHGITVTFAGITHSGNTITGGTVTITASSATLSLGGAVTSTIGSGNPGDITGSYDVTNKVFSLTMNSVNIAFSSFVNITATSVSVSYNSGTNTSVTLSDGNSKSVSVLTVSATGVTIFAGLNGPSSNASAVGIELADADFALALFQSTTDSTQYYALKATAGSITPHGLPSVLNVTATQIAVDVNSGNDGTRVVDFTKFDGGKLTVGDQDFDFDSQIVKVDGTVNLDIGTYLHVSGSFGFAETGSKVSIGAGHTAFDGASDVSVTLGTLANPFFVATGYLSMSFDASSFVIATASLTIPGKLKIGSLLEVDTPSVTLSNLTIDRVTGDMTGTVAGDGTIQDPVITLTAVGASLFPGGGAITASVSATNPGGNGFQGTFNLRTDAFSITLQEFDLSVGSAFTAHASGVTLSFDPTNSDPHQQLVEIASGTVNFVPLGLNGNLSKLTIYEDGFHFDSLSITKNQDFTFGALKFSDPTLTLTDFGVTFGNSVTVSGSIGVSAATASLFEGNSTFSISATNLSFTVNLSQDHMGEVTIAAGELDISIASRLTLHGSDIEIDPQATANQTVLSVGSASLTLDIGVSLTGTATNFGIMLDASGTPELVENTGFTISVTATPGQLKWPSWLGISIDSLSIDWPNGISDPTDFRLMLSATVTSISGLGSTSSPMTFSGSITDVVIDIGKLKAGEFPITSIGGFGVHVSGKIFGADVSADLLGGITQFNAAGQIVLGNGTVLGSDGNPIPGGDSTITGSVFWGGLMGQATLPGFGTFGIRFGVSSLGPLSVYVEAGVPIILEPISGLAITNFRGGIDFDSSLTTPANPFDLRNSQYQPPLSQSLADWKIQLQSQVVNQYLNGGSNFLDAFNQPMLIHAGATLYDAYVSTHSFTADVDITIDTTGKILVNGTATFGDNMKFKVYLFADLTQIPAVQITFLMDSPADTPVESVFGQLNFGFVNSNGDTISPGTPASPNPDIAGFYISITGGVQYSAFGYMTVSITGTAKLTTFTDTTVMPNVVEMKLEVTGLLNVTYLGDLAQASGVIIATVNPDGTNPQFWGAVRLQSSSGIAKLNSLGLDVNGAAMFEFNSTNSVQNVVLPDPTDATLPGLNVSLDKQSASLVVSGTTPGTYAHLTYTTPGTNDVLLDIDGGFAFDISSASGVQVYAVINGLHVGPPALGLVFNGWGLLVINDQGLAAELSLNFGTSNNPTGASGSSTADFQGITLNATFTLVINTTSQDVNYTIPDSLPPVPTPGGGAGTTRILTIARGPPQADGTVGATGPYLVITGSGTLDVVGLTLTGFFRFEVSSSSSGTLVSLVVHMTGDISTLGNVTVDGAFQIDSDGAVALLVVNGGAGTSEQHGPHLNVTFNSEVAFNTTGNDVAEIGGVNLPDAVVAHSFSLVASGTLTFDIGGTGFVISGLISYVNIPGVSTTYTVDGTATATVAGKTLLTMHAAGGLFVDEASGDVYGGLVLTAAQGNPLSGAGYSFTGTFELHFNTTGAAQTIAGINIAAGPNDSAGGAQYIEVHAHGNLIFGTATNGFQLNNGDFYLSISTKGLAVSASATMAIVANGTPWLSVSASGAMLISSSGFAASLSVDTSFTQSGLFYLGGTFTLQINTTGAAQQVGGVNIPAGPGESGSPAGVYFQMSVTNAKLILGGTDPNATTALSLEGNFYLTISSNGIAISTSANVFLKVAGVTLFSFSESGALLINGNGIAAKISLSITSGGTGNQFSFVQMTFVLEVNSTNAAVPMINDQAVNLAAGRYFRVAANGYLKIATVITISASFDLTVTTSPTPEVNLQINGTVNIFGIIFTINIGAGIYSDGIEINAVLGLSSGGSVASFLSGIISIDAQFVFQINTSLTKSNHGVAPNTAFALKIHGSSGSGDAKVYVFGFELDGSLSIYINGNGKFAAQGNLNFNFFGFKTLQIAFYFDSQGNYWFEGSIYLQLGSDDWNIHGTLSVIFASANFVGTTQNGVLIDSQFKLHVDGGVTAFGWDFASVGADVEINGTSVDISAYVSVSFYFFSIGGTVTIHLGSLATVPPPPPPHLADIVVINGLNYLRLNLGTDATNRGVDALPDETYTITSAGAGSVYVYAPAVYSTALQYSGITGGILVNNSGTSNLTLTIANNVTLGATINCGSGIDHLIMGGGLATIYGGTGSETVIGGTGGVAFHAGAGKNVFIGGHGNNTLYGPGFITVIQGYQTVDTSVNPSVTNYYYFDSYSLINSVLVYHDATGSYSTTLVGNSFLLQLTAPNSGPASFVISNFGGSAILDSNGNPNTTANITTDGNLTLNGNVITGSNGNSITLRSTVAGTNGQSNYSNLNFTLQLNGGAGANIFTINSWSGTTPLSIDGKGGSDTFKVNFVGSGNYTVNVNDTGATGTDSLIVNGTLGDDTLNIASSSIIRGSETVNYAGVESITVNTFTGKDTVNINNPAAAITINGGNGNGTDPDTFNINLITSPLTINTGTGANTLNVPVMNNIFAQLTINGGGTDTLNLTDTGADSGVLGANSLTGFFGGNGSGFMTYSSLETINFTMGQGTQVLYISGRSGLTNITSGPAADTFYILAVSGTTNINAGGGINTFNFGSSLTFNAGFGQMNKIQGTINITGSGNDIMNVDDSGSTTPAVATLRPTSLEFGDPVTINFTGVVTLNLAFGQGNDLLAVVDTFTSASTTPVITVWGNGGDDIFSVLDTHAVMTINGGDGDDSFYIFGNSSVLFLNGDAGDDSFYIFASILPNQQGAANVDAGAADSNGNSIYTYRVNAPVHIDGGTGHDKIFIFGTVLNDVITIDGTHVTGAGVNVDFVNCEELTVAGLGGDDTFYILSVAVPTTVEGDGSLPIFPPGVNPPDLTGGAPPATSFNDTFYVGWQGQYTPGSLSTVNSTLTIQGNEGNDVAYLDNSGDRNSRNFTLTDTTVDSDAFGPNGHIIYDSTLDNLNILSGAGNDHFTINGNDPGYQTTIDGGAGDDTFVVNAPIHAALALHGEGNTFPGDTLTINGTANADNFVITGATVDGAGATISYGTMESLTINGLGGNNTFTLNGDSIPTWLNGGPNNDTFTVNANSVTAFLDGGDGNDTFNLNGNSGQLTASGNTGNDTFILNGNSGAMTLNGDAGNDSFVVNALSSPATLNGGADDDTFTVNTPLATSPTINGGTGVADTLIVNGSVGNDFWVITNSTVGGVGAPVIYSSLDSLVVNGISGNDTFNVRSTSTGTSTTLNTGTGLNTINVGSTAPVPGGIVDGIQGALIVAGNGNDVLNIDDSGSVTGKIGTLTSTTLTGMGMAAGGITFGGISVLNISLGAGADTLTIANTPSVPTNVNGNGGNDTFNVQATTGTTTLNGGAQDDTFNLGSLSPGANGNVNAIAGLLNVDGGAGVNVLHVDETGELAANTGFLTATTITGLGLGLGVNYSSIALLRINLGQGSDTFNIQSTNASTSTTLTTGGGTNTINVGSEAPGTGGTVNNIAGPVLIAGNGNDILNVDDTGDTASNAGTLTPSGISGLGMGPEGIGFSGLAVLNISLGSGGDTFGVNDMASSTVTTIDGGAGNDTAVLNFGNFNGTGLNVVNFENASLNVEGNFAGHMYLNGPLQMANIGGTLTRSGYLSAGSIGTMTIGYDLAGTVVASDLLDVLSIGRSAPGEIHAGDVNVITVGAGYGNRLLDVFEGGVERQIQAAPVEGGAMPGTVTFAIVYDSQTAADPQAAIRVTNGSESVIAHSFDLSLTVSTPSAKFNLALLFADGPSGISNIMVEGDLLSSVSQPALNFFDLGSSPAGVVLPSDSITGVEVRDSLPIGFINVAGIEGVAFGTLLNAQGKPVNTLNVLGSQQSPAVLHNLLGSKALLLAAVDAFLVPFSQSHVVTLYAQVDHDSSLDLVMSVWMQQPTHGGFPPSVITARVQLQPAVGVGGTPVVTSMDIFGNGAAFDCQLSVDNVTSTGPLGNITVRGNQGLGNVTAPEIFGSIIVTKGSIFGVILTTGGGIEADSLSDGSASWSGNIGDVITKSGKIVGVTSIFANLGISGQIISNGDLVSSVQTNGAFSGTMAAKGNIGAATVADNGTITRFGGISVKKNDSGQIIALGNLFENISIGGTLTGRIGVKGAAIAGLDEDRIGILGNVTIKNFAAGGAVVSGGLIGDAQGKTAISFSGGKGFLAGDGAVTLGKKAKIASANVFRNARGTDAGAAIDAIFTDSSVPLGVNGTSLSMIQTDLNNLGVVDGVLGGTTP
jgi:hypothetical protein